MKRRWWAAIVLGVVAVLLLGLWLARTMIAVQFARSYFDSHGVRSSVEIGELGFSGVSARFALGAGDAPELSAERIELHFDPLRWMPYVTEVRLVHPLVRARIDDAGNVTLGSLQAWIDSLRRQQGKSPYVSDDLIVSLAGLRLMLTTPAGPAEVDGDVRLEKNLPAALSLQARPTNLAYRGMAVTVAAANLTYDQKAQKLSAGFSGSAKSAAVQAQDVTVASDAAGVKWAAAEGHLSFVVPSARLHMTAASVTAGLSARKLDVTARNLSIQYADGRMEGAADLGLATEGGMDAAFAPLQAADPALAGALRQNLKHWSLALAGHAVYRDGKAAFTASQPVLWTGAKGATARLSGLTVSGSPNSLHAVLEADLAGPGLPAAKLTVRDLLWSGGGFTAKAAFDSRFQFAMLRGVHLSGQGSFSWQNGQYAFTPSGCVQASLAAFHPGASDLAKNVQGDVCAPAQQPLLTGEGAGWTLTGEARNASADLPLATAHVENVTTKLAFDGQGAPRKGTATITTAQMVDRAASQRFKPLTGSGTASLADGIWRGRFAAANAKSNSLGEATFVHTMATGSGTAHIDAPKITFTAEGEQPADLSPLLVALRRAEGTTAFTGDVDWTPQAITSRGKLTVLSLDFMTPLGKAHAVKSDILLISLLPPATAPGQSLTISRIDWTLPFSAVDIRFGFGPTTVQLAKADTDIAEGHASLGAITLSLANPGKVEGAAEIKGISLNALVTASNLGGKVKLEGKVSGHIPFAMGPDGFRIINGHVAADGPGRLSVDRSLWAQGEAAISSNAVQDFAYQALEYLAFDQMSADLNSVANGRLQIVFRIKGKSAPPKPQTADVAITDILNGTALYKPIPLPSGTPIDLTLDTSLNFDELLKSYAEAWSKTLSPEGQPDRNVSAGAKP
ncbi:MAG TPA: YdbH domain-containing protein [Rhizomicrobium sp.]|nr:YdbH domain-containing protein [Rhizomicrobium sp.]